MKHLVSLLAELRERYNRGALSVVILLFAMIAHGQIASNINGIRIKESGFDSQTRKLKLVFINDSPADVTAWVSCIRKQTESSPDLGPCQIRPVDASHSIAEHYVDERDRPWMAGHWATHEGSDVIRPGQEHILEESEIGIPVVVDARMEIVAIVLSDGTVSCANIPEAKEALRNIVRGRRDQLIMHQRVAEIAAKILDDPADGHPVDTMIAELNKGTHRSHMPQPHLDNREGSHLYHEGKLVESEDSPEWREMMEIHDTALYDFKHPHHRELKEEAIPANQREYLKAYLADQQAWIAAWNKYQIGNSTGAGQ